MSNLSRIALPLLLLAAASRLAMAGASASPAAPVAIVGYVEGSATLRAAADAPPEPLSLFRRLAPGAVVETAAKSTVTLVFFDGQRLALQPETRVVVRPASLKASAGQVRRLAPVPEVLDLAPLLRDGAHRRRASAVRIRGAGSDAGLEPRDGASVSSAATTLSFTPAPEVEVYHLVVEDESGTAVFTVDVDAPRVQVPPGLLRPGTLYYWRVEPKMPPHPEMVSEAVFSTLNEQEEHAREALAEAARRSAEPDLALLLAEVDRSLDLPERQP